MNDDRKSGLALVAGTFGLIVTMALHPTGHDLFVPGQFRHMANLVAAVHLVGLASMPVCFLGACGLTLRLAAPDRLALAALVLYGFGLGAAMAAATVSGLVAPELARQIIAADASAGDAWRVAFRYNGQLNQAFAQVFVAASSCAIVLWSIAIVRHGALTRVIGVYGCILGPVTVVAVVSGHLRLDVHGFGLVIIGQAIWMLVIGVQMCWVRRGTGS